MTHTVTLLADHKGYTRPRVHGDEYVVDAEIDITAYTATGETVTAASLGLNRINTATITRISGGLSQYSFNLIKGTDDRNNVYIEINKEDDTSGVEAELGDGNTDLDGTPIQIRVYGIV